MLQQWTTKCKDKNNHGKEQNVVNSTKSSSPTGSSGSTSFPPIGDSFMYIEASGNSSDKGNVFVSFERTDVFQISNIGF